MKKNINAIIIFLCFIIFLSSFFIKLSPQHPGISQVAAIALIMAILWITEIVPLAVTSLLPVFLFPLFNIMDGKEVCSLYLNDISFLFIGGFLVALAMERWQLHKRMALKILILCGCKPEKILLGFIMATGFLSMWISNTSATMIMVPIAFAIIIKLEEIFGKGILKNYATGIFLGIAYSATIGGTATLVGTPPNMIFAKIFSINFPGGPEISFTKWFLFAFPFSVIFLFITWLYLSRVYKLKDFKLRGDFFKYQHKKLGVMSFEEIIVFADFMLLVLLWLFRSDIRIFDFIIPGWANLFSKKEFINDGTIAILMTSLLFFIPSRKNAKEKILSWETAGKLPWDIVLLFGGGFALAAGFQTSGLTLWLGEKLKGLDFLHPILIVFISCLIIIFLNEMVSNTAITQIILPVFVALSIGLKINPLLLMVPVTLACSCGFMLPAGTPPNAIVFGTRRLKIIDMAKTGFVLNIISAILITLIIYGFGKYVFDIDFSIMPNWAELK